jgi:hypothetical protein
MDRFYRWKTKCIGMNYMSHINAYDDLFIPLNSIRCKCNNIATHIVNFAAREEYACKSCGEEFLKEHCGMPAFTHFCLTFSEVEELDKLECPNMKSYTRHEAVNIYLMNKDLYKIEEAKYTDERIWFIIIDAKISKAHYRTLSTEDYKLLIDEDCDTQDMKNKWQEGYCKVLFAEPSGRVIYVLDLKRPSKIEKIQE